MSDPRSAPHAPSEPLAHREPGHPLSRSSRQRQRTLETYLEAAVMPRYMERLRAIQDETRVQLARLERNYRRLQERYGEGSVEFRARWMRMAGRWRFEELNELIRQHNEWYPIEARLPMDPRTGDYVSVRGRPYRREPLDAAWVLSRFPA